jgi:hypothetical protein
MQVWIFKRTHFFCADLICHGSFGDRGSPGHRRLGGRPKKMLTCSEQVPFQPKCANARNWPPFQLALNRAFAYIFIMTSVEIIEEIKRLPRAEQDRVIDFVRQAGVDRPLTPDELGQLAKEMAEAKDPVEADRLQAEIVRGFYGGRVDA